MATGRAAILATRAPLRHLDYGPKESSRSLTLAANPESEAVGRYEPLLKLLKDAFLSEAPVDVEGGG